MKEEQVTEMQRKDEMQAKEIQAILADKREMEKYMLIHGFTCTPI
jgi:hypothetical protein